MTIPPETELAIWSALHATELAGWLAALVVFYYFLEWLFKDGPGEPK